MQSRYGYLRVPLTLLLCVIGVANARAQQGRFELVDLTRTSDIAFGPNNTAYAVGSSGPLLKSTDAGVTWQQTAIDLSFWVTVCTDGRVFVGTETGFIESDDAGQSWSAPYENTRHVEVLFCLDDADLVFQSASLFKFNTVSGLYVKLYDLPDGVFNYSHSFSMSSNDSLQIAYVGCEELSCGAIANSYDGGQTFVTDTTWSRYWPAYAVATNRSGTTIVTTDSGYFKRSITDREWAFVYSAATSMAKRLISIGSDSLLALQYGNLSLSTDGGHSFQQLFARNEIWPSDVAFRDGVILVAGSRGIWRLKGAVATTVGSPTSYFDESEFKATAFPNPFRSSFQVSTTGFLCDPDIELYDMTGREVPTTSAGESSRREIRSEFASGHYVVRACCSDTCASTFVTKLSN